MAKTYYDSAYTGPEIDAAVSVGATIAAAAIPENRGKFVGFAEDGSVQAVDLGRVAVVARGAYDPAAEYERLDAVSYNGSSYLVRKHCQGVEPAEGEYYMLLAKRGDDGLRGPQGEIGPQGPQGPQGPAGDNTAALEAAQSANTAADAANSAAAAAREVADTVMPDVQQLKYDLDNMIEVRYSPNMFDKTSEGVGSGFISKNDGKVYVHATYWHSDYIPIKKDELYIYSGNPDHKAIYNSDKTYNSSPSITNRGSWVVFRSPVDGYIRFTIDDGSKVNKAMIIHVDNAYDIDNYNIHNYIPYYVETLVKGTGNIRDVIEIKNNGIDDFYEKMLLAFNTKNCDVYVRVGEYVMSNEFVETVRSENKRGVPIGNGCHYYFDTGAKIICDYTGNNKQDVVNYFSPLDTLSISSDFEIYNVEILAKNVCYALHDEANGNEKFCRHVYKNCKLTLDNTELGENGNIISKALGGGLGKHEEVIIEDCVFSAINPMITRNQNDASYHGANNSNYTDVSMVVTNCWFDNMFRVSNIDDNVDTPFPRVIYSGNSSSIAFSYPSNWNVKAWNNNIRTN